MIASCQGTRLRARSRTYYPEPFWLAREGGWVKGLLLFSRSQAGRWSRRVAIGNRRAQRLSAGSDYPIAEEAECVVVRARCAGVKHAAVSLAMELLAGRLKRRPGVPPRVRRRELQLRELGGR